MSFDAKKFLKGFKLWGPGAGEWWGKRINLAMTVLPTGIGLFLVVFLLFGGLMFAKGIYDRFFGKPKQSTSSTALTIEKGANVGELKIVNRNNGGEGLKHGLYIGLASDRATVGVFKEVAPNIDIELGAGQEYDGGAVAEAKIKLKF